jgi:hypothetical protein
MCGESVYSVCRHVRLSHAARLGCHAAHVCTRSARMYTPPSPSRSACASAVVGFGAEAAGWRNVAAGPSRPVLVVGACGDRFVSVSTPLDTPPLVGHGDVAVSVGAVAGKPAQRCPVATSGPLPLGWLRVSKGSSLVRFERRGPGGRRCCETDCVRDDAATIERVCQTRAGV